MREHIFRQNGEGRCCSVVGDLYRFFATGRDTDGKYAMWEATVPPGGGPPPHTHSREEEAFYILEGEITFMRDETKIIAGPGTFVNMPIGSRHSFRNESGQVARMIISVAPAGLEEMFFEVGRPLAPGESPTPPSPSEIEKLLAAAPRYGVEIHVPKH